MPTINSTVPTIGQKIWFRLTLIPAVLAMTIALPFVLLGELWPHRWRRRTH